MRKILLFNTFATVCHYSDFNSDVNNGYGCNHPEQAEDGSCFCHSCPLGIEAEQEDLSSPDIDRSEISEDEEISEEEYILLPTDNDATPDQERAVIAYERYMHRYDSEWLKINS